MKRFPLPHPPPPLLITPPDPSDPLGTGSERLAVNEKSVFFPMIRNTDICLKTFYLQNVLLLIVATKWLNCSVGEAL